VCFSCLLVLMLDISVVLYNPDLQQFEATLQSLSRSRSEYSMLRILVSGSTAQARDLELAIAAAGLTENSLVQHRHDNLGFSSGHNLLMREAFLNGATAVLVLNPDVSIAPFALRDLCASAESYGEMFLYGPTLRRTEPTSTEDEFFDSAGIGWTASGRHFDISHGEPWSISEGVVERVKGVTGACLLVTAAAYETLVTETGHFFDDSFLAYREDAELGIRAGLVGVPSVVVHQEGFSHVRTVRGYKRGSTTADLLGVKNRYLLRWKLGTYRPGRLLPASLRDIVVVLATFTVERRSLPGLRQAFAIRKYSRFWGRHLAEANARYERRLSETLEVTSSII
jgi:GT2 family glycosyltransferase